MQRSSIRSFDRTYPQAMPRPSVVALAWLPAFGLLAAAATLPEFDFSDSNVARRWVLNPYIGAASITPAGLQLTLAGPDPYLSGPAADYPAGQPLWLRLDLLSETGGTCQVFYYPSFPTEANSVRFAVPAGMRFEGRVPVPALGNDYRIRIDPPGTQGTCLLERLWFEERTAFAPPTWPRPTPLNLGPEALVLRAGKLSLRHADNRLGAFEVRVADALMAVGYPTALLGYTRGNQGVWTPFGNDPEQPAQVVLQDDLLSVQAHFDDPDGARWRVDQTFAPQGDGALGVTVRVTVNQDRAVLHLPLFTVLPGVGSFGTNKVQALFSGLEYLANEPSSSEADIRGDGARRLVPDHQKITQPLMALAVEGRYLGLIWEPDPDVAAVFDSPDRQFGGEGHLIGLVAPGSDGSNRDEGSLVPYAPLPLAAGQSVVLRCTLLGGPGKTVVPAVQQYVALVGLPEAPETGLSAQAYYRQAAQGWLDSRIREGDLYRHAWWPGFDPQPAADAAMWMTWLAGAVDEGAWSNRLLAAAQAALRSVPGVQNYNGYQIGQVRYPLPALLFNQAFANANQAHAAGNAMLTQFEPDGSVLYRPAPGGTDFGVTHFAPDANGHTANVVLGLLENAVFGGDDALIQEALRRLQAMAKFRETVPRGAQTWEVPLHTPDILAAANLVRCYTLAFQLTGDPDWLDQARYWAWTGVPFVYLRPPVSGAIGTYATIPVFGATAWVGSWFGRPVQWCGLVYADALNRLAMADPSGPWRHLADGIAASGVQQSWPATDAERVGLLPDFLDLDAQYRDGPAINPATLLGPAVRLYGREAPYTFVAFPGCGLRLRAPGLVTDSSETGDRVRFTMHGWSAAPATVYLNGFHKTPRVWLNDLETPLDAPHQFDRATGRLGLRLRGTVSVEILYPERPALDIRRAATAGEIEIRWPRDGVLWHLQTSPALGPSPWTTVGETEPESDDEVKVILPAEAPAGFFRLQRFP